MELGALVEPCRRLPRLVSRCCHGVSATAAPSWNRRVSASHLSADHSALEQAASICNLSVRLWMKMHVWQLGR